MNQANFQIDAAAKAIFQSLRPHYWAKNLLVFVPLLYLGRTNDASSWLAACIAFFSFSLVASSTYILNDLRDSKLDVLHPTKKKRPIANGSLPVQMAAPLCLLLGMSGLSLAVALSVKFFFLACLYFICTLSYSFFLRGVALADVGMLGVVHVIRLVSGSVAANAALPRIVIICALFFFLSFAFVKRVSELVAEKSTETLYSRGRGYEIGDLLPLVVLGVGSAYLSLSIFCFCVAKADGLSAYGHPGLLFLFCPILFFWLNRIWLLALRGRIQEDPLSLILLDPFTLGMISLLFLIWAFARGF